MRGNTRSLRLRRPQRRDAASRGTPSASSSGFEAKRKAFWEIGFAYRLLGASYVVRDTAELERSVIHVPDSVAGHWYAVARLADAAGVDQGRSGEAESVYAVVVRDLPVEQPEYPRHVGVAVKADLILEQLQVGVGHGGVEHIFVDVIAGACMDEQDLLLGLALRQIAKPIKPLLVDHFHSPTHHRRRVLIEPLEDGGVGAGAIVIAHQRQPASLHHFVHATRGIPAVTDDVAKAERFVDSRAILEYRRETLPVGVYVRKDRDLQAGCFSYRR